jgi:hypothetical protein
MVLDDHRLRHGKRLDGIRLNHRRERLDLHGMALHAERLNNG